MRAPTETTLTETPEARWLLLIHQIPPKPDYFRVKIWRRLQRLGAVALKNSVYVLPRRDGFLEDFQWVRREIAEGGGEATVCEARFVDGLSDVQVTALFHVARDADYAQILEDLRAVQKALPVRGPLSADRRRPLEADLARLERRLAEVRQIDHLNAPGQREVEDLLEQLRARLSAPAKGEEPADVPRPRGRTWVTRKGIHVDRIASAWLIRRFIDRAAKFKFVAAKGYRPGPRELRFDMYEAEYTHEGDRCTFEVLLQRFGPADSALMAIAEIVHDIDLRDDKFNRDETAGVERLIVGLVQSNKTDTARLTHGSVLLDGLYRSFGGKLV